MQGLGVFGEVLSAVRRVEAFRKNNQACTRLRGLQDLAAGIRKVNGLIRTCSCVSLKAASSLIVSITRRKLDESQLQGLLQKGCHSGGRSMKMCQRGNWRRVGEVKSLFMGCRGPGVARKSDAGT